MKEGKMLMNLEEVIEQKIKDSFEGSTLEGAEVHCSMIDKDNEYCDTNENLYLCIDITYKAFTYDFERPVKSILFGSEYIKVQNIKETFYGKLQDYLLEQFTKKD